MFELWNTMPTLLIGELLILGFTITNLYHAYLHGYKYLQFWLFTITTGFINDHLFMLMSLTNTFWHAEGSIMLTDRMPLYILGVYNILLYPSIIVTNNIVIASFISGMLYGVYDLIGNHFIWWTWHTTDTTVLNRWYGVPYSSTCWSIIHSYSFYLLYNLLTNKTFIYILSTPVMMLLMGICSYPINNGIYHLHTLIITGVYLISIYILDYQNTIHLDNRKPVRYSKLLYGYILIYIITMVIIYIYGSPSNHYSYGIHQTFGPNNIYQNDILGNKRQKYLSINDNYNSFTLVNIPRLYSNKYLIKGI